jgi:hypothetical protein
VSGRTPGRGVETTCLHLSMAVVTSVRTTGTSCDGLRQSSAGSKVGGSALDRVERACDVLAVSLECK